MLIDEYLDKDGTRDDVRTLIETEKTVAKVAVEAEKAGDESKAVKEWEKIFESDDGKKVGGDRPLSTGPTFINRTPSRPHCNVRLKP